MKVTSTASAIRATFTVTEARELVTLARDAAAHGLFLSDRLTDMIALLDCARHDVQMKQAVKRADRNAAKVAEQRRRERERYFVIDDLSVSAIRADYADASTDPDFRLWVDLILSEALNKPLPDQCEIRRDVWCVRVVRPATGFDPSQIIGSDCTETADPAEIRTVAERLIRKHADALV
ncbi:hypothetical protein [Rhizorhabdus histidinilytica]|uniref:hypothetical protein n=1 Tax=Rhizorhabdus histidinilytica TaxID=439228 RepID=UPI00321F785C